MKQTKMMKVLGIISVIGITMASTASMLYIHEPKRPSALK